MVCYGYRKILICLLGYLLLLTSAFPCVLFAQELKTQEEKISSDFETGLEYLSQENFQEFEDKLQDIKLQLRKLGYLNAPEFSLRLLQLLEIEKLNSFNRLRIISIAKDLSPTHPEVLISLSSHFKDIGIIEAGVAGWNGILRLNAYPFQTISICLAIVVASMLAIFTLSITWPTLSLVLQPVDILSFFASIAPKKNRILYAVPAFLLMFGIASLMPIAFIGMYLSVFCALGSSRMRFAPLLASSIVLVLTLLIAPFERLIAFSNSPQAKSIENLRAGDFVNRARMFINSGALESRETPFSQLLAGQSSQIDGELVKAKSYYESALASGIQSKGLIYVISSDLAQLDFQSGDQEGAFIKWKALYDQGWREKELLYNLAIASVALYKKSDYEKYFSELKSMFNWSNYLQLSDAIPMRARIPSKVFWELALDQVVGVNVDSMTALDSVQSGKYFYGLSSGIVLGIGSFVFILGAVFFPKAGFRFRYRVSITADRSVFSIKGLSFLRGSPTFGDFYGDGKSKFLLRFGLAAYFVILLSLMPRFFSGATANLSACLIAGFIFIEIFSIYFNFKSGRAQP